MADDIKLTLEEEVTSFLSWIGYDEWKDDVVGIIAYGEGPILNPTNKASYELGTQQFHNLANTLRRILKEREEEDG